MPTPFSQFKQSQGLQGFLGGQLQSGGDTLRSPVFQEQRGTLSDLLRNFQRRDEEALAGRGIQSGAGAIAAAGQRSQFSASFLRNALSQSARFNLAQSGQALGALGRERAILAQMQMERDNRKERRRSRLASLVGSAVGGLATFIAPPGVGAAGGILGGLFRKKPKPTPEADEGEG